MNTLSPMRPFVVILALGMLALGLAGCATNKVDWSARIGHYTYDQAVVDLGPPDRQATLQDGTTVAEWLTQRAYVQSYSGFGYYGGYPYPYYRHYGGYYAPPPPAPVYWPDYYLRLVFGPDKKLVSWKKFSR